MTLICSPWLRWPYCDSVEMSANSASMVWCANGSLHQSRSLGRPCLLGCNRHGHRTRLPGHERTICRRLCRRGWCGRRIWGSTVSMRSDGIPWGIGADELDVVHGLDGVFGLGVLGEAHEAEAAAAASVAVLDHDLHDR
jgi:hypothetical protein